MNISHDWETTGDAPLVGALKQNRRMRFAYVLFRIFAAKGRNICRENILISRQKSIKNGSLPWYFNKNCNLFNVIR